MATLRDLLEQGNLGAEKTASVATPADADGMDKLAMSLGLFGDVETEKVASDDKDEDDEEGTEVKEEKKASLGSLHASLFPNSILGGAEKTAAEKVAEAEERLGAAAYDQFSSAIDSFVTKLASEMVEGNPHGDSQPSNRLPNNKPGDAGSAIDTAPKVTNMLPANNDAGTVGHYQQKSAALRKHLLLSSLED